MAGGSLIPLSGSMLEQWSNGLRRELSRTNIGFRETAAVGELVLNKVKDWQNPIDKEINK